MAARNMAEALAAWCGTDEVNGAQLAKFYSEHDNAKKLVQAAKSTGQKPGLRSFIACHSDLLTARMQDDVLYVGRSEQKIHSISELSTKLKALAVGTKIPLQAVNDMLKPLKDGDSMRHFASQMKEAGLCLANGALYGEQLPRQLKSSASLRVNKATAKQYPLVKKCLVLTR